MKTKNLLNLILSVFLILPVQFICLPQAFAKDTDLYEIQKSLGKKIDLTLTFTNEEGETESLQDMLNGQEALILTLNYYACTTMCTYQFLNLSTALKESKLVTPGKKPFQPFRISTISFNPNDTVQTAKNTHDLWVPKTGNPNFPWHFYVGNQKNIEKLTNDFNFYYEADDQGNYSHAAALFFIQKDGTFHRYLFGMVYDKNDIEQALLDTSHGEIGSFLQKILSHFKIYDPNRGKYASR